MDRRIDFQDLKTRVEDVVATLPMPGGTEEATEISARLEDLKGQANSVATDILENRVDQARTRLAGAMKSGSKKKLADARSALVEAMSSREVAALTLDALAMEIAELEQELETVVNAEADKTAAPWWEAVAGAKEQAAEFELKAREAEMLANLLSRRRGQVFERRRQGVQILNGSDSPISVVPELAATRVRSGHARYVEPWRQALAVIEQE